VAEKFSVRPESLVGQRRTAAEALPRQVAMYPMRHLTEMLAGRDRPRVRGVTTAP
jgi:chromosomal replication initiation ATPase DnaA